MTKKKATARALSEIITAAGSPAELAVLLEGMLTPGELEEVIVRWELLCRLLDGQTQRDIAHELGISLGKIARGSRLLKYGPVEFRRIIGKVRKHGLTRTDTDR